MQCRENYARTPKLPIPLHLVHLLHRYNGVDAPGVYGTQGAVRDCYAQYVILHNVVRIRIRLSLGQKFANRNCAAHFASCTN